jgi:alkaline phosphatase D
MWTILLGVLVALSSLPAVAPAGEAGVRIAFGSCLRQWQAILDADPDVFLFLGDNVYTDIGPYRTAPEPERIARAYEELGRQPGYLALRRRTPVFAIWDDHDYGRDNAGADYPWKETSEAHFLDFFNVPADAEERARPGTYAVRYLGDGAHRVQLLLLDTRYFRSPLRFGEPDPACPRVNLLPETDAGATLLGAQQWRWLEARLREPARLRIIASSIQVIPDGHCFEKWANFPRERERLFDLIRSTGAAGVVIVSGDRHLAEISRLPGDRVGYPLYEITASGMNSAGAGKGEQNPYRVTPDNVRRDNFGMILVDWEQEDVPIWLQIRDSEGNIVQQTGIRLSDLRR